MACVQELSRSRPLVVFLDDLHWADVSTVDLLSFLAGKFEGSQVLVVVTYRPSDMLLSKHPFLQIKSDLQARGVVPGAASSSFFRSPRSRTTSRSSSRGIGFPA